MARILPLNKNKKWIDVAAEWFSSKWQIPSLEYKKSMLQSIETSTYPKWYIIVNKNQEVVAGCGVIENDFHERKDSYPDICALYVEKEYRNHGIASRSLDYVRKDFYHLGVSRNFIWSQNYIISMKN